MQLFTPPKERRAALAVLCGDQVVFSDPLSRTLFGEMPPALPKGEGRGRLISQDTPYLLFRRDLTLEDTDYALYLTIPVSQSEAADSASLALLSSSLVEDTFLRFSTLFAPTVKEEKALASFSLPFFFHTLAEGICANLYAPLAKEALGHIDPASFVRADRADLMAAVGLALFAMLREGQSGLSLRLAGDDSFYTLSLVGERGIGAPFLLHALDALARRGGFAVRHTDTGVRFLLFPSHAPAALLRSDPLGELFYLKAGFFLLP